MNFYSVVNRSRSMNRILNQVGASLMGLSLGLISLPATARIEIEGVYVFSEDTRT